MDYRQNQGQGEASSYYNQQPQGHGQYSQGQPGQQQQSYGQQSLPPPYGNQRQEYSPGSEGGDGERGLMGAVAGGAAGAFAGHKMGHGVLGALGGAFAGHKLEGFVDGRKEKKEKEEEENRKKHEWEQQQQQHHGGNYGGPPPQRHDAPFRDRDASNYSGNFSSSARDMQLESGPEYYLRASCRRENGDYQTSSISLNRILANEGGYLRWTSSSHSGGGCGSNTVTVQQGDTLREIARRLGNCSWEDLARHNNIANPDMIYPGQTLQVPGSGHGDGGAGGNFSASARNVRLVDGGRVLEAELRYDGDNWRRTDIVLDERIGNDNGVLRFK